ncbi:Uncharacterised protein [Kingella potus]|uniref:Uncharacterized protein n=1 Tax=Kingella potus TaxID=265175 RepID=A0A377QY73_9NEIS|nr:hypothetical protein [Kingella potus]UOP01733.1 hypothetical protein LVJ84_06350 [Kingella potus]STQ99957.1 Uncharacterised protein [Kingella potus]
MNCKLVLSLRPQFFYNHQLFDSRYFFTHVLYSKVVFGFAPYLFPYFAELIVLMPAHAGYLLSAVRFRFGKYSALHGEIARYCPLLADYTQTVEDSAEDSIEVTDVVQS